MSWLDIVHTWQGPLWAGVIFVVWYVVWTSVLPRLHTHHPVKTVRVGPTDEAIIRRDVTEWIKDLSLPDLLQELRIAETKAVEAAANSRHEEESARQLEKELQERESSWPAEYGNFAAENPEEYSMLSEIRNRAQQSFEGATHWRNQAEAIRERIDTLRGQQSISEFQSRADQADESLHRLLLVAAGLMLPGVALATSGEAGNALVLGSALLLVAASVWQAVAAIVFRWGIATAYRRSLRDGLPSATRQAYAENNARLTRKKASYHQLGAAVLAFVALVTLLVSILVHPLMRPGI